MTEKPIYKEVVWLCVIGVAMILAFLFCLFAFVKNGEDEPTVDFKQPQTIQPILKEKGSEED